MVCVGIVKDAQCKTKIRDTLILQKRSVPAEIFLSLSLKEFICKVVTSAVFVATHAKTINTWYINF